MPSTKRSLTSYPKDKIKILLTEGVHKCAVKEFNNAGYHNIEYLTKALSEQELLKKIKDVHLLGIRSKTNVPRVVFEKANKLLGVGCFCIGVNQVDLDAATETGVTVFNSPYSNTRSVAELVIASSIMLVRKIPEKNEAAHRGVWLKEAKGSYELRGKTIGIIGYGHIGSQVSVLGESMGLNVIYYDIVPKLPLGNARSVKSLNELLKRSDVVTLHVPATSETKNMMTATRLRQMKKGSILLNLSRGNVVDIDALKDALDSKHLSGAAIDVFPVEPKSKGEMLETPLRDMPNVILTPHIGGSTVEAQENIGMDVSAKLINLVDAGATVGSHTVPPLSLPTQKDTNRILHIHHNVPGVLSEINSILRDLNVNIVGQYLKTNEKIGYVVLDIEGTIAKKALEQLKKIEHTIRARILY